MANVSRLGEAMDLGLGIRSARRFRVLLAHDATAPTCDALADAFESALSEVDLNHACSADDARAALQSSRFHACLVCLDLPPAPNGGVRLAQEVLSQGAPVVLVTRSLRWIPPSATALRDLPWVAPDAKPAEVARAIRAALNVRSGSDGKRSNALERWGSAPWFDEALAMVGAGASQ